VCCSAGIFATTIQAQDFKDEEGDRAVGRRTIPIVFPSFARWTVIVPLLMWSSGLSLLWGLDVTTSLCFITLGLFVGVQFLISKTVKSDQISFYWYNVSKARRAASMIDAFFFEGLAVHGPCIARVLLHVCQTLRVTLDFFWLQTDT
jgi:4-hydroxybenzoate polyprenyltransferase